LCYNWAAGGEGRFKKRGSVYRNDLLAASRSLWRRSGRSLVDRRQVFDRILSLSNCDCIPRIQDCLFHSHTVDLDAIGTVQVSNDPIAVLENKLAMLAGYVRIAQADIARLPPAQY
jgi:hypothetical protein